MKLAVFEVLAVLKIVVKCISMFYTCSNVSSRFVRGYAASQPARGVYDSRTSKSSVTFRTHK
jgi:hypothetical protein